MTAARATPIPIFLVDDHELIRTALRESVTDEADIEVVGEAATAMEALAKVPVARPDVALLDLNLPDGNGIELCRELRSSFPSLRCLIVTQHSNQTAMLDAVIAGASGYVTKDIGVQELRSAIRRVAAGEMLLSAANIRSAMARLRTSGDSDLRTQSLTKAERDILELVAQGLSNREIAERRFLAEQTVKNYVSRILSKLGMKRRTEAAVFSARLADEKRRIEGE